MTLSPADFFDQDTNLEIVKDLVKDCKFIWEILPKIKPYLKRILQNKQIMQGTVSAGAYLSKNPIYIHETAIIEPGAFIQGPAYIGADVVVRHGAYVRDNVILLNGSLLGHASEAKNSLFFPHAYAPHFNYVGDSVLGSHVNLGAGTKLSNLAIVSEKDLTTGKRPTIKLKVDNSEYDTGLDKLGAILGNHAQTGCNSVLNPGCLVGKNSLVYANTSLRKGYYPPNKMIKLRQEIEIVEKKLT